MTFDLASPAARDWHYFDDVKRAQADPAWRSKAEPVEWTHEVLIPARTWNYYDHRRNVSLPIGEVDYYRCWPEAPTDTPEHRALCDDISMNGIMVPLVIYTNGTHALLAEGNHRLAALKELGRNTVPVAIVPNRLVLPRGMGSHHLKPVCAWAADYIKDIHRWHRQTTGHDLARFQMSGIMHVYCSCGAQWLRDVT